MGLRRAPTFGSRAASKTAWDKSCSAERHQYRAYRIVTWSQSLAFFPKGSEQREGPSDTKSLTHDFFGIIWSEYRWWEMFRASAAGANDRPKRNPNPLTIYSQNRVGRASTDGRKTSRAAKSRASPSSFEGARGGVRRNVVLRSGSGPVPWPDVATFLSSRLFEATQSPSLPTRKEGC